MSNENIELKNSTSFTLETLEKAFEKLDKDGFCVIENVMSPEKCTEVRNGIHEYMKKVGIDFNDPTLKKIDYPNQQGIIQHLGVCVAKRTKNRYKFSKQV